MEHEQDGPNQEAPRLEGTVNGGLGVNNGIQSGAVGNFTIGNYYAGNQAPELPKDRSKELIRSLKFDEIAGRRSDIENAYLDTCRWLLKTREWAEWQESGRSFTTQIIGRTTRRLKSSQRFQKSGARQEDRDCRLLWFKGKAGSGKSTLMKFAVLEAEKKPLKGELVLSHFFLARGSLLQRSTEGMYRTLLVNVLETLAPETVETIIPHRATDDEGTWKLQQLIDLLRLALSKLNDRPVVFFIDALDECLANQVKGMVDTFLGLIEDAKDHNICFRVCFASRHYQEIPVPQGKVHILVIEDQRGHKRDISIYIDNNLISDSSSAATEIRQELHRRACGSFIYVKLVVEILLPLLRDGKLSEAAVRLKEQGDNPNDMSELYDLYTNILRRDQSTREDTLLCVQWILFAQRPLTPKELWSFLHLRTKTLAEVFEDAKSITLENIERYIRSVSKGLVEFTKSEPPTVQFIHETVRDFFFQKIGKNQGLGLLDKAAPTGSVEAVKGWSHDCLTQACHTVLLQYLSLFSKIVSTVTKEIFLGIIPPDLVAYCQRMIFIHADTAQKLGKDQSNFLHAFNSGDLLKIWAIQEFDSLLHILVREEAGALIYQWYHFQKAQAKESTHQFGFLPVFHPPVITAVKDRNHTAMTAITRCHLEQRQGLIPWHSAFLTLLTRATLPLSSANDMGRWGLMYDFGNMRYSSPILYIAAGWSEVLAAFSLLLRLPPGPFVDRLLNDVMDLSKRVSLCDVLHSLLCESTVPGSDIPIPGQEIMLWAARTDRLDTFQQLVRRVMSASLCSRLNPDLRQTALHVFARRCFDPTWVRTLVAINGVDPDVKDWNGSTPLHHAAQVGNSSVVKLLLDKKGVDANSRNKYNKTPLHCAVDGNHPEVLTMLLKVEQIDVNARCDHDQTPLHWAVFGGFKEVVAILLKTEQIDINAQDDKGRTPKDISSSREMTKLLSGWKRMQSK